MSCDPATKYGIHMENNNIGTHGKACKLKQDKENQKILRCLYFYKPNKVINKQIMD